MLCCGFWWSGLAAFFFLHVFSFKKSRRCDDNQQITVSHFGEHKRLHLESSKQNYYIISFTSNNESNLHFWGPGNRREARIKSWEIWRKRPARRNLVPRRILILYPEREWECGAACTSTNSTNTEQLCNTNSGYAVLTWGWLLEQQCSFWVAKWA